MTTPLEFTIQRTSLIVLACGAFCIFVAGISDWQYGFVGDEFAYFDYAKQIARANLLVNPFNLDDVYGIERTLGSYWQAIWIWLIGANVIAWRLANVILIVPAVLIWNATLARIFNARTGLIGAALLGSSYFLMNFFKIGYTHPSCFLCFLFAFHYAAKSAMDGRALSFGTLGVVLGISFYLYVGPVFPVIFLPPIAFIRRRQVKGDRTHYVVLGACYLAIVLIGLLTTPAAHWAGGLSKTIIHREFDDNAQIAINIGRNFVLFFVDFDYGRNHFVTGPYLDSISQVLAVVGAGYALVHFRSFSCIFILATWSLTCIVLGLINPYSCTPSTRGMFFVPFGVAFASIALDRLMAIPLRIVETWPTICGSWLIAAIVVINIYRAHVLVFQETGYHEITSIIREVRAAAESHEPEPMLYLSQSLGFSTYDLYNVMQAFGASRCAIRIARTRSDVCQAVPQSLLILKRDPNIAALKALPCLNQHQTKVIEIGQFDHI
ncbi:MAG TPA: glycosyltransferase family 39 protein [Pirellulales bacterium]|jgi:hypothetical protein|nr:glycosyltransferase family 39 protein [Pirellulales bacterium]